MFFLSFRGTDTRKTFVDHLYHTLQDKGIRTYKDDEEIKKGKKINDELIRSIQDSKFYIVVFSKDYASSSWCLEELVKILECQKTNEHTAYPLFYDVEPTEVRQQSGPVGEAFSKHEKEEAAEKWREALKEAADLAGWELKKTADGHEAKLIKIIVKEILPELRYINSSVDEKLVGMETRVKDVLSLIETGADDVRMIGIKGMGGGGKTTLARAIFDQISFRFEGKSFVENVREVSKASLSGLTSLQHKVLSDVLNDQNINISSVYDGKHMLKRRMSGRKVLVVLDDVDHMNQLEALAGESTWFKKGSRIIITTRYEQVLVAHHVKLIRNVNLLSDQEAISLFSRYAFAREIPVPGYEKLSGQVVRYAAGLPLTIKVLGSFLCGKDESEWIDAIERLKTIPLEETLKRLELSYIDLEDDCKEIFLHLACMLKGYKKKAAIEALESCGFHARNGLRVLEQKSLITINNYERVDMHDHIEEMGRDIVRRSRPANKHSRLWKEDEIEDILINDLGTEATIGMKIHMSKLNPEIMKGLRKMKELKFLDINASVEDFYSNQETDKLISNFLNALGFLCCNWKFNKVSPYFPDSLQYLCWDRYPFRSLPQTFRANNLVALKMTRSKMVQFWEGSESKVLNKLRILDLSDSSMLRTLDLGLTPNLETLTLEGCKALVELSESICMSKHLKSVKLDRCLFLEKLPKDLGQLECLEELNLLSTMIKHLPDSISKLKHLRFLRLYDSPFLEQLPEDLGLLECLEELNLSYTKIKHLPDSICMLKHLKSLNLLGCRWLEKLPEDLGRLECLERIDLSYTKIKNLPNSICMLKHLKSLRLFRCGSLEKLPEDLSRLECLKV
ncbi:disease resistance protein RPV1 [Lactuca sativa]|uniref:disease resistance protein RPV1 n=1 Tax=Lactuca sativa TaxID=4236 RepID=UPI0022AF1332|nr:disease resistance protein RPV1 [Lactuca sativa]